MLGKAPLILSGREETLGPGKDTGRYWDAGAANVHWVIATSDQVEEGLKTALRRISEKGVLIEGNSFLKYLGVDYSIMVAGADTREVKSSAARIMPGIDALFVNDRIGASMEAVFRDLKIRYNLNAKADVYNESGIEALAARVLQTHLGAVPTR
jgi:hypothetical protein